MCNAGSACPSRTSTPSSVRGLRTDDVLGAVVCREDGIADPAGVTRELVRRAAERGVDVRERTDALELEADVLVVACGARLPGWRRPAASRSRSGRSSRQLADIGPIADLPADLPMVIEGETTFHFRRVGADRLRLAMTEPRPRWGDREEVDEGLVEDWRARAGSRYPPAAGAPLVRAWAGLYDMTPDAHPVIGPGGDGLYLACGFSGHGFMQAPAVGAAVADELLDGASDFDLSPYRLERFAGGASFPETLVL